MDLEEMRRRKHELGYSNKRLAELSGVPLGTVQKIFSGATKAPREESLRNIWKTLANSYNSAEYAYYPHESSVHEDNLAYKYEPEGIPDIVIDSRTRKWRRQGSYTVEDLEMLPEDFRVELIDGVLYDPDRPYDEDVFALATPEQRHQYIVMDVSSQLHNYVTKNRHDCVVLPAPAAVQLEKTNTTLVEPDVFVVCDKGKLDGRKVVGAPDLVIEVLSRSSSIKDQDIKLKKYWRAGVREYWIIDPFAEEVTVYHFESGTPPDIYTFDESVPVGICPDGLMIDFRSIKDRIDELFG